MGNNKKEIWKDIPGYIGIYKISNLGRVKSLRRKLWNGSGYFICKEKILKEYISNSGYKFYYLINKDKQRRSEFCHRLILLSFIGFSKLEVNHKDGNKQNNELSNLEYVTSRENKKHAWRTGLVSETTKMKLLDVAKRKPSKETRIKMSISSKKAWIERRKKNGNISFARVYS